MHFNCNSKGFKRIYDKKLFNFEGKRKQGGLGSGTWLLAYGKSMYKSNNVNEVTDICYCKKLLHRIIES